MSVTLRTMRVAVPDMTKSLSPVLQPKAPVLSTMAWIWMVAPLGRMTAGPFGGSIIAIVPALIEKRWLVAL